MTSPTTDTMPDQIATPLTETPWLPAFLMYENGQWYLRFEGEDYTWPTS